MKREKDDKTWKWLFRKSKKQHGRIFIIVLCNAIFAASSIGFALVCKGIIDSAVNQELSGLKYYAGLLFGIIVLQLLLRLCANNLLEYVKSTLGITLKQEMLALLMKKEYQTVSAYHSGELLNRMYSDVQDITDNITGLLPSVANMMTQLILAIGVLLSIEARLTWLLLVGGICIYLVMSLFRKKSKLLHKEVKRTEGIVRSFLQEAVESLLIIKVFGSEKKMEEKANQLHAGYFKAQIRKRNYSIAANAGINFVFRIGYFVAMLWGAMGIYSKTLSYGSLTAILQLINQVQSPFAGLSGIVPRMYGMLGSAERLMELEELPDEVVTEVYDRKVLYQNLKGICFSNVSFSYGRNEVLSHMNFRIEKGDFAAVTGLSGGGKSTLFLLMLGAYVPHGGEVYFEMQGTDGSERLRMGCETRSLFAYVPQGNYLFSGTLRENIMLLTEDATEEEVQEAVRVACADEFIGHLPDGMETYVGERGFGFSEGQVQRIAIARAILSRAPILLFDEATSALDERTEAALLENIAALKDRTCFIVTHRKAALGICNKEIVVETKI